ncbi:MAG: hypothetical protein IT167_31885 [Bryobacterales bacterium]|nr:hypothetical protein [Bryobacterales bacterium]
MIKNLAAIILLATPAAGGEIPWPAESMSAAANLTEVEGPGTNDFHVNLSSAFWNPQTRRLWVCRNGGTGGSKFWALREDGNGSFEIDYQNGLRGEWSNFGDLEAVTQADYGEAVIYLLLEGEERIKEYSIATYGTAILVNNWNTAPHLPAIGSAGAEGLCFVPDAFLAAQGFVDGSGNPYLSRNGMGGIMLVAHQNGGRLYAFDLNRFDGSFTFVGSYQTNYGESCELAFDRSDGRLYILHGANWNRIEVATLGSSASGGELRINELFTYGRPTGSPPNWNLEGFAIVSNDDCSGNQRSVFVAIDDGGAESLLWYLQFPCTQSGGAGGEDEMTFARCIFALPLDSTGLADPTPPMAELHQTFRLIVTAEKPPTAEAIAQQGERNANTEETAMNHPDGPPEQTSDDASPPPPGPMPPERIHPVEAPPAEGDPIEGPVGE